jgi:hypothetical protein
MQDYNNEQWYLDLQKSLEGFTEDYLKKVSDGKLRQLEGAKNGGNVSGQLTQFSKTGIHNEKFRKQWASLGGYATIDSLLQWQKDNNHNIGELAKVKSEEWIKKISESLSGRKLSKKHIENTKKGLKKYYESLTKEQRSTKYSNDSASRKSLKVRTSVLNLIETDTFTTTDAKFACEKYGLGNWKAFLKDKRIIKQIHKGTNQNNPSIYVKIK